MKAPALLSLFTLALCLPARAASLCGRTVLIAGPAEGETVLGSDPLGQLVAVSHKKNGEGVVVYRLPPPSGLVFERRLDPVLFQIATPANTHVTAMTVSRPDEKTNEQTIAVGYENGVVNEYDALTGAPRFDGEVPERLTRLPGPVFKLLFTQGPRLLLTVTGTNAALWMGRSRTRTLAHRTSRAFSHLKPITTALFTRNGTTLLTADESGAATWWPLQDIAQFPEDRPLYGRDLIENTKPITAIAMDRLRSRFFAGTAQGSVILWVGGKEKTRPKKVFRDRCNAPVTSLRLSPDGNRLLAAFKDGSARVWDVTTEKIVGRILRRKEWGEISRAYFIHTTVRIVTTHMDGVIRVWDLLFPEEEKLILRQVGQFSPLPRAINDLRMLPNRAVINGLVDGSVQYGELPIIRNPGADD